MIREALAVKPALATTLPYASVAPDRPTLACFVPCLMERIAQSRTRGHRRSLWSGKCQPADYLAGTLEHWTL